MQDKGINPFLGQTGIWLRNNITNEIIFNAVEKLMIKLMDLIKNKFISENEAPDEIYKTHIPDKVLKEIKDYLQLHFTTIITDSLKKDFPEVFQYNQADTSVKLHTITPGHKDFKTAEVYNVTVQKTLKFSSEKSKNNFYLMLNYYLENVFMAPLFIITLASRAQQRSISLTAKSIREYEDEVKRLIRYQNIVERPTNPREEFVRDILVAINNVKEKKPKVTIMAIAKELKMERPTFYDKCSKLSIRVDKNFNVIDRKTKETFVFSQK